MLFEKKDEKKFFATVLFNVPDNFFSVKYPCPKKCCLKLPAQINYS